MYLDISLTGPCGQKPTYTFYHRIVCCLLSAMSAALSVSAEFLLSFLDPALLALSEEEAPATPASATRSGARTKVSLLSLLSGREPATRVYSWLVANNVVVSSANKGVLDTLVLQWLCEVAPADMRARIPSLTALREEAERARSTVTILGTEGEGGSGGGGPGAPKRGASSPPPPPRKRAAPATPDEALAALTEAGLVDAEGKLVAGSDLVAAWGRMVASASPPPGAASGLPTAAAAAGPAEGLAGFSEVLSRFTEELRASRSDTTPRASAGGLSADCPFAPASWEKRERKTPDAESTKLSTEQLKSATPAQLALPLHRPAVRSPPSGVYVCVCVCVYLFFWTPYSLYMLSCVVSSAILSRRSLCIARYTGTLTHIARGWRSGGRGRWLPSPRAGRGSGPGSGLRPSLL